MSSRFDLVLSDVSFSYAKEPVLENVTFKIERLDFATVVGPNGSGKTTLLKLLAGLEHPASGTIRVLGQSPRRSRLSIGYMPQFAKIDMDFPVTVLDFVLMGRLGDSLFGWYSKRDREFARKALQEVALEGLAQKQVGHLSGGQRQRALLARSLCCDPKLLLLDEPTANIDPTVEESLFGILEKLNERMTIVLVSHDLGFVSQIVKSVICVNRKVAVHPTSEVSGSIIKELYERICG